MSPLSVWVLSRVRRWCLAVAAIGAGLGVGAAAAAPRVPLASTNGLAVGLQKQPEVVEKVRKLREKAARNGIVKVVVALDTPFAPEPTLSPSEAAHQRKEISDRQDLVLTRIPGVGMRAGHSRKFETMPFVALTVSIDELDALLQSGEVVSVDEDGESRPSLAASVPLVFGSASWYGGISGAGQAVAVLDTGVDKSHPFLAGKVVSEACYSTTIPGSTISVCPGGVSSSTALGSGLPCDVPSNANGGNCLHGTHVAGIVAGNAGVSSQAPGGVAKDAAIISVQVFSKRPDCGNGVPCVTGYDSDVLAGLERVYSLRGSYSIASVNLSLGRDKFAGACDTTSLSTKAMIDNLRAASIAVVVASGNDGFRDGLSFPACISSAIAVGSTSARSGAVNACQGNALGTTFPDAVSCFSNSAATLDLLAPGQGITSAAAGGGFVSWSGTSMAAPHVAGGMAVLRQKKPTASVTELLGVLTASGVAVVDPRNGLARPRMNLRTALDTLGAATVPQTLGVSVQGNGVVTSSPAGISCGSSCSASFAQGTIVTLSASPASGFVFSQWQGDCTGAGACNAAMSQARSVVAVFAAVPQATLTVAKSGAGSGVVARSGKAAGALNCGVICAETLATGQIVTLTAAPDADSVFAGWGGACSGSGACSFSLSGNSAVTASFAAAPTGTTALLVTQAAAASGALAYSLVVPAGATNLAVRITGGTGDADLYVRAGLAPTLAAFDCRPFLAGNEESCSFAAPSGTYFINVNAASAFAGVTLSATYQAAGAAASTATGDLLNVINLLLF